MAKSKPAQDPPRPTDAQLAAAISAWLPGVRWFAGKAREITAARVLARTDRPGPGAGEMSVALVLGVELDGAQWQVYQVPVLVSPTPRTDLAARLIADIADLNCYDALGDPDAPALILGAVSPDPAQVDPARTHRGPQAPTLQAVWEPTYLAEPAKPLSVEQSNTSLRMGTRALMKVFRRLIPGINPDVEVSAALGRVGCSDIAEILGWVNGSWLDPVTGQAVSGHMAMIQELLSPAVDGWDLSRERVAAGADFAADSYRLGLATGEVHRALAAALPSRTLDGGEVLALTRRLHDRLSRAAAEVPEIAAIAPALHNRITAVADLHVPIVVQRVHGDYHLGQVLLADSGWKLLDFEGEPGGAIADRIVADHPLRDVAAMLRSYDYAAHMGGAGRDPQQVQAWRAACELEFLRGYRDATASHGTDPLDSHSQEVLLAAYTVDKAAYEAVYETHNRPDWLEIPMAALRQLAG